MLNVIERLRLRKAETVANYGQLVQQLAAGGREPDAETVGGILDAAGKTADDLVADIALAKQRKQLAATVGEIPGLESELRNLEDQLQAVVRTQVEEEQAARAKGYAAKSVINAAVATAQTKLTLAHDARAKLSDIMPPEALTRLQPLWDEARHKYQAIEAVERERIGRRQNGVLTADRNREATARIAALEGELAVLNARGAEIEADAIAGLAK